MEKECSKESSTIYSLFASFPLLQNKTKQNKTKGFTECRIILVHLFHHHKYINIDAEKKHLPSPLKRLVDEQAAPNNVLNTYAKKKKKENT